MKAREKQRFLSLVYTVVCVLVAAGCVPVRTGTVIQNPAGQKYPLPKLLIAPGTTTRQQVEQEYKAFSIDTGTPNLFWGRFRKSAWYLVSSPGGRAWGTYNLLVRFDSDGNVQTSEVVHDKELVKHFVTMSNGNTFPTLDLSKPVSVGGELVSITSPPGTSVHLQLFKSDVVVTRRKPDAPVIMGKPKPRPPEVVTLRLSDVTGIRIVRYSDQAKEIPITIAFSHKTKVGKQITFRAVPSALLTLVRWQNQGKE